MLISRACHPNHHNNYCTYSSKRVFVGRQNVSTDVDSEHWWFLLVTEDINQLVVATWKDWWQRFGIDASVHADDLLEIRLKTNETFNCLDSHRIRATVDALWTDAVYHYVFQCAEHDILLIIFRHFTPVKPPQVHHFAINVSILEHHYHFHLKWHENLSLIFHINEII